MDVSIIIVNWNTRDLLDNCLESVYEHAGRVRFEVIVVDNASSDGSAEMVRSVFPGVLLILEQANRGYAAAVNSGTRRAKGRYLLILNSDTLICDSAIEKTVRYADKHPEVAVVGCQVRENQDKIQTTCFRFPSLLNLFLRASGLGRIFKYNLFFGREAMLWWGRDDERQVDVVSGMFMLVRREAILQVGLMDEDYFLYCEDTDWCYRFAQAGWKMLFWPGAMIIHPGGGGHSGKEIDLKLKIQMRKSILIFFRKHYGLTHYLIARLLLVVYTGLRWFVWALMLLGKRAKERKVTYELEESRKRWFELKYCAFGMEPEDGELPLKKLFASRVKEMVRLTSGMIYTIVLPFLQEKPCRVVLYYHGVGKHDIKNFKTQMVFLAKSKCKVVKVSEILTAHADGCSSIIAITFDDAFASVIDNALPILREHRLPAGIFVPVANLGQPPRWKILEDCSHKDEVVMSQDQVAELDNDGFEVFSHTLSHPVLTGTEDSRLEAELANSKWALEKIVGHEVSAVSYPHGVHDARVCSAARRAGYKLGFTIEPLMVDRSPDNMRIGRFLVSPRDSLTKFRLKVNGAYQAVSYLTAIKKAFLSNLRQKHT